MFANMPLTRICFVSAQPRSSSRASPRWVLRSAPCASSGALRAAAGSSAARWARREPQRFRLYGGVRAAVASVARGFVMESVFACSVEVFLPPSSANSRTGSVRPFFREKKRACPPHFDPLLPKPQSSYYSCFPSQPSSSAAPQNLLLRDRLVPNKAAHFARVAALL